MTLNIGATTSLTLDLRRIWMRTLWTNPCKLAILNGLPSLIITIVIIIIIEAGDFFLRTKEMSEREKLFAYRAMSMSFLFGVICYAALCKRAGLSVVLLYRVSVFLLS